VLGVDAVGLGKGRVTLLIGADDVHGGVCSARQGEPDPLSQTRGVGTRIQDGSSDLDMPQEESTTVLFVAKVIVGLMARDCVEWIVGLEPLIKVACRCHLFPIDVAPTASKYINIKLMSRRHGDHRPWSC